MAERMRLGGKLRTLRRKQGLTQAKMAERLSVSPSYLNLLENDRRPLSATLLIELVRQFDMNLADLSGDDDARLEADLMEVFSDGLFDQHSPTNTEVRELVGRTPNLGRAVLTLYRAYAGAIEQTGTLAATVVNGGGLAGADAKLSSEEVTEIVQRRGNTFPELEDAAERLWIDNKLDSNDLYGGLARALEGLGVSIRVVEEGSHGSAIRRFDPDRRVLYLSEVLAPRSRLFQVAVQIGLLTQRPMMETLADDPAITTDDSRTLLRMVLAGHFAGAVLMPYGPFLAAARATRHDIELLGHRFRTSFEQVCHRLSTLRRPGSEGIPFHFVKIDTAGNISKRFSGSGIRFARFGGACPRWNVARAFLHPNDFRIQFSRMPGGETYFCVARTVIRRHGGYRSPETVHAVGLGCKLEHARDLVYADGIDLERIEDQIVPIGTTCRLCERTDCDQRAFPSIQQPLRLDENVRAVGFYNNPTKVD